MLSERERMCSGDWHNPYATDLVAARRWTRERLRVLNLLESDEARHQALSELLGSLGKTPWIEPVFRCDYGFNIHIGDRFYANVDCIFLDTCEIKIGNDCMLGPRVGLYTVNHPLEAKARRTGIERGKPIHVGDDVWIGGGALLLPGVTVGNGSVIAAGAVVTKHVPEGVVVGGNPARILRTTGAQGGEG